MQTFSASIHYIALPYERVIIGDDGFVEGTMDILKRIDLSKNPTDSPRFWRDVCQLYFAFKNKKKADIRSFYLEYGKILSRKVNPFFDDAGKEQIQQVIGRLNWFRVLTLMVERIKTRKLELLWEMFGEPQEGKHRQIIYFANMEKVTFPILPDDPPQQLIQPIHGLPTIRYLPKFDPRRGKMVWFTPRNDSQLLSAAWEAVTEAITDALQAILLIPESKYIKNSPLVTWGFLADGALQAAFLQWFFQEIANIKAANCAAEGCSNIVLPPRKSYCSEKCRQRDKKRRQRENKKLQTS